MAKAYIIQLILSTTIVLSVLLSCNNTANQTELSSKERRELAIQKNDAGAKLSQKYLLLDDSDSLFFQAIDSLDKSIKYDSTYSRPYYNKAGLLAEVDSLNAAIGVLEKLIRKDSTQIMAITQQGFFYERLGDSSKAQSKYAKAIKRYEQRIGDNPDDVFAKSERAFLFLFTHSKKKALEEINKVIQEHPGNQTAIEHKKTIQSFDRDRFIQSY